MNDDRILDVILQDSTKALADEFRAKLNGTLISNAGDTSQSVTRVYRP